MSKSGYKAQQKVKELNRSSVMTCLKDDAKRFKDLKEITGFSPMGLTKILAGLESEGLIERKAEGRWTSYVLTKKGTRTLAKMTTLDMIINKIQNNGGKYHHDYSGAKYMMGISGPVWGIQDELVIDREIDGQDNPISDVIVRSMHVKIFEEIKKGVKDNLIKLDEKKKGEIVLGFVIDYSELVKSINDNSLAQYNKIAGKIEDKTRRRDRWSRANDEISEFEPI